MFVLPSDPGTDVRGGSAELPDEEVGTIPVLSELTGIDLEG